MAHLHVLTTKEAVDPTRLADKIVVVLDVLFATSTIVAALAHGAREVIPVVDEAAAWQRAAGFATEAERVLSGEKDAITLPGFVDPTPLALVRHGVAGRSVVYATTNGTVALDRCRGAAAVYAGALLNAQALVDHLAATHGGRTVLLVCAGSGGRFNLEDFHGAGLLAARLEAAVPSLQPTDAARAAVLAHGAMDSPTALAASRLGRRLIARGLEAEVRQAACHSLHDVVPCLREGRLTSVGLA